MMTRRSMGRCLIAGAYVALALMINPVLIEHHHPSSAGSQHSDRDICAWLDHVAGAGVVEHAVLPLAVAVFVPVVCHPTVTAPIQVPSFDPIRGPPLSA